MSFGGLRYSQFSCALEKKFYYLLSQFRVYYLYSLLSCLCVWVFLIPTSFARYTKRYVKYFIIDAFLFLITVPKVSFLSKLFLMYLNQWHNQLTACLRVVVFNIIKSFLLLSALLCLSHTLSNIKIENTVFLFFIACVHLIYFGPSFTFLKILTFLNFFKCFF